MLQNLKWDTLEKMETNSFVFIVSCEIITGDLYKS